MNDLEVYDDPEWLKVQLRKMDDDEFMEFENTIIRLGLAVADVHQERMLVMPRRNGELIN